MADTQNPGAQGTDATDIDMEQKLANLVNSAVTAQLKRTLGKTIEETLRPHLEGFAALREAAPKQAAVVADKGAGGDETTARLASLEGQLKAEREARKSEKAAAYNDRAFTALKSELAGKVRPEAVEPLAKLLFHADKRVKVTADGTPSFVVGDDEHDLAGGVAAYLNSPEAAMWKPAPAPVKRGPGQRLPERPAGGGGPEKVDPIAKTKGFIERIEAQTGQRIF